MVAGIGITHVGANETIADLILKERAAHPDISFLAQPTAQDGQYFYDEAVSFLSTTKAGNC
jgi:hypothetical protein